MSVLVSFRLSFRIKQQVEDIAKNKGMKVSEVYREAVTDWVRCYTNEPSLKWVYLNMKDMDKKLSDALGRLSDLEGKQ